LPQQSAVNNAHADLAAPYGIYRTADGWLALAMTPIPRLGNLLGCPALLAFDNLASWFDERDPNAILTDHLATRSTDDRLALPEPGDVWCADVLTWPRLLAHGGFAALGMTQRVARANGAALTTTRCPIRIAGAVLPSERGAPTVGEDTAAIRRQLDLLPAEA
jgi:CoA:oxalate CoA-transferase